MNSTSRARRLIRWITLPLAVSLSLAACGSGSTEAASDNQDQDPTSPPDAVSMTDEQQPSLPEIDPSDYQEWTPLEDRQVNFDMAVPEAEARTWAEASGFRVVAIKGDFILADYSSQRIVLQPNEDGDIIGAEVG